MRLTTWYFTTGAGCGASIEFKTQKRSNPAELFQKHLQQATYGSTRKLFHFCIKTFSKLLCGLQTSYGSVLVLFHPPWQQRPLARSLARSQDGRFHVKMCEKMEHMSGIAARTPDRSPRNALQCQVKHSPVLLPPLPAWHVRLSTDVCPTCAGPWWERQTNPGFFFPPDEQKKQCWLSFGSENGTAPIYEKKQRKKD